MNNKKTQNIFVLCFFAFMIFVFASCQTTEKKRIIELEDNQEFEISEEHNPNLIDYLFWRGDLTFDAAPFNEIDAAIFTELSYLKLDALVSEDFENQMSLKEVEKAFFSAKDVDKRKYNGPFIGPEVIDMFQIASHTKRFENVKICFFKSILESELNLQFASMTFIVPDGTAFVAFRGTHEELLGWKEDFYMTFKFPIYAQIAAVQYIDKLGANFKGTIKIGGHSKGGNMAIYSATYCNEDVKQRITDVYNFDGPGFVGDIINDYKYIEMIPKFHTFVPEESLVGILFDNKCSKNITKSHAEAYILQHDVFSWDVIGTKFDRAKNFGKHSQNFQKTAKRWLSETTSEEREKFIDAVFGALDYSGAKTLTDLATNFSKYLPKIRKYLNSLDEKTSDDAMEAFSSLVDSLILK